MAVCLLNFNSLVTVSNNDSDNKFKVIGEIIHSNKNDKSYLPDND